MPGMVTEVAVLIGQQVIREAIAACLKVRAERGMPLTIQTQQVEVAA